MNVSERAVYSARRLLRTGRADLLEAVESGRMSVNAALIAAGVQKPPNRLARLHAAFETCTIDERTAFFASVQTSDSFRG